jgi:N4-gp56 family major capsid protein
MSITQVSAGDALAVKLFSAAFFAQTQRQNSFTNSMTGPAPTQAEGEAKLRNQTDKAYPFVRVTDLAKTAGDTVSVDMFHTVSGKPIMGDRNAEGKGQRLTSSSMDIKVDSATQVVDAGGQMTQKRTKHSLRTVAQSNLVSYFGRLNDQLTLVHLAGTRGQQTGTDWVVPLETDPDYAEITINPVRAPTFNRHFVCDGNNLIQGGQQLASIDTTDVMKLEHIDALSTIMNEQEFTLQPIQIADDPAAADNPMYVLLVSYRVWNSIQNATSGAQWRTFLQNAWTRASYGSKHPLFKGDCGMWGNFLIRRMPRAIRLNSGATTRIVTAANRLTATESDVTVATLASGNVDRCLLLGGQAMAHVYGRAVNSETFTSWKERKYNFERSLEVMGDMMNGRAKLRFNYKNPQGLDEVTDHGVAVIDCFAPGVVQ